MKTAILIVCLTPGVCIAQSPEKTVAQFFKALSESDKDLLVKVVHEPNATRIGKSIIAAAPMFHRKKVTAFFEMIFDRVPTPAEIAKMSPMQAFAEYMCDPVPDDPSTISKRTILGTITEGESLAHVVYRVDGLARLGEKHRDVVTCIKHNGEWRVVIYNQVWEAYMNYMLRPAMARLSDGKPEQRDELQSR